MKGVVLAGGHGTRLRPLTVTRPKQLLPVANRPVLSDAIEGLLAAGVDELAVVVGGAHSAAVRTHFADYVYDASITVIEQGEPRGVAHAVGCAESFVDGEPFVVSFADTLLADDTVAAVVEGFDPTVFDCIAALTPSSRGELELTEAIDTLLGREGHCQWQLFDGRWIDVGTPEDLLAANRAVLDDLNSTETAPHASI